MNTPCYVLFANAQPAEGQGVWSFTVQPLDGSPPLSAADVEPEVSGERLELLALVRALEALDQPGQVMVCCDSPRIERQLNQGFDDWRAAGWRWEAFGSMTPIPNADLWRRIDRAMHIHRVSCRRTPSALAPLAAPVCVPAPETHEAVAANVAANSPVDISNERQGECIPAAELAATDTASEPMTLRMPSPAATAPAPKRRRPRRMARAQRAAPTWDQLVDHLRQGMQRLRTVAATLA